MKFVLVLSFLVPAYLQITLGHLLNSTSECEEPYCQAKVLSKDDGTDLFQASLNDENVDEGTESRIFYGGERKLEKKQKSPNLKGQNKDPSKNKKQPSKPSSWLSDRLLRKTKKEKVERYIHEGARVLKKKMKMLKETKSNSITALIQNHNREINSLIKMSNIEMKTLMAKLSKAKYLTTSSAMSTVNVGNQTAAKIGDFIEKTGQDLCELAETYTDQIEKFADDSCKGAKKILDEGDANKACTSAKELQEDLSKITYCSDIRLHEIVDSSYQHIKNLADTTGKQIVEAATQITAKFEEIGKADHQKLQEYIDFGIRMINEMAQKMHTRLLTLAEECFKKVRELEANNQKAVNDLGKVEGDICIAIVGSDDKKEKELRKIKTKIKSVMEKSNKKKFDELMNVQYEQLKKFREEIEVSIDKIQACKANEASEC